MYNLTVLEIRRDLASTETKIKVSAMLLLEALGENTFLCLFQLLETACILWLMDPSSIFKASTIASSHLSDLCFHHHISLSLSDKIYMSPS